MIPFEKLPASHQMMTQDPLTRRLYASDASIYEQIPAAVSFPECQNDLQLLIDYARHHQMPVTMRAAGTSLAGQTTGGGIVADISRFMHRVLEIDPRKHLARVQPGVIRDQLNRQAASHGLLFGPDTSTTNRCMLGGMIGNNSCGSYSITYGTTREHVRELHVVLSDGSCAHFRPLSEPELDEKLQLDSLEGCIYREMVTLLRKNRDLILQQSPHPDVSRRNTGYAIDRLCEMHPITPGGRPFNLCELLCGSEGTLALISEAVVQLVPVEKHKILLIPQFASLQEALESAVEAVSYGPAAAELVDEHILDATRGNVEQNRNRFFLEGDPKALLLIEFQGGDLEELRNRAQALKDRLLRKGHGYAHTIMEQRTEMDRVWDLRKAGLGLLMGHLTDANSPEFVDDTAVRVQDLPAYIADFQKIMERYDTRSVYYAHASVGELHLRPILNIKTPEGLEKMKAIAVEVADLVRSYRGSLSGEHGDGRLRSHLIERMVGPEMMQLLRRVKEIWDPDHLLNRGKIIDPEPMDRDLRYSPSYPGIDVETVFHWRAENGFGNALELCNGAGVCRKKTESGGTMCPSYRATLEERDSTRGRANIFRQIFSERQVDGFTSGEIHEALKLCLSCKACKTECPANVDMAKMKAEYQHGRHLTLGVPFASRFFGSPARFYPLAGALAPLVNFAGTLPPVKGVLEQLLHIHPDRQLPAFTHSPFTASLHKNGPDPFHVTRVNGTKVFQRPRDDQRHKADGSGQQHQQDTADQRHKTDGSGQQHQRPLDDQRHKADADGQNPLPDVLLLVDWFTEYHEPGVAGAALDILERLGCRVTVMGPLESGRTQISRGLLDQAKERCESNIRLLTPYAENGFRIVGLEPSEILTFRDEYPDLCDESLHDDARTLASSTRMIEEFLAEEIPPETMAEHFNGNGRKVRVHGHCYTKALTGNAPIADALRLAGFEPVVLDTGCCGMAGSFGYDKDHYEVSMQIGEQTLFPALRELDDRELICSHGFSCRHQISDGTGKTGQHTVEIIWPGRRHG